MKIRFLISAIIAKALGIRMGAPFFQIKDVVKQHGVAVFSSNYELYGDMSARVMKILSDMAQMR